MNEDPKNALLRKFELEIEELRKQLQDAGITDSGECFNLLSGYDM